MFDEHVVSGTVDVVEYLEPGRRIDDSPPSQEVVSSRARTTSTIAVSSPSGLGPPLKCRPFRVVGWGPAGGAKDAGFWVELGVRGLGRVAMGLRPRKV